ncbi:MAG TPA: hypothetical protein DCE55_15515 [Planctomycetaceae bacterium]|nr:hypothetical protein [Planctomycetaceae bacterium]
MNRWGRWILVLGMLGCGTQEHASTADESATTAANHPPEKALEKEPAATAVTSATPTNPPSNSSVTSSALTALENLGAQITRNPQGQVDRVDFKIDNNISDAGLAHLTSLRNLQQLGLGLTAIGDDGLAHVSGINRLQVLVLTSTRITDRGLIHLAGLSRLQELYLSNTQITDAGLEHFEQLSELRKLRIDGTRVTKSGVAELQKALPDCIIVH